MIAAFALALTVAATSQDAVRSDIDALEQRLTINAGDTDARWKLLYLYFERVKSDPERAIPARRRHIVWFIEHRPNDPLLWAGGAENRGIIVPRGDASADPGGFDEARAAWLRQVDAHPNDEAVLRNAIVFLLLNDKPRAEALLTRARSVHPSAEWSTQLGFLYAIGIMGLDGMMGNLGPSDFNPQEVGGPFAAKARRELETATDPLVIGSAGYILTAFGIIHQRLATSNGFVFEAALAEQLLTKAAAAQPDNEQWKTYLSLLHKARP